MKASQSRQRHHPLCCNTTLIHGKKMQAPPHSACHQRSAVRAAAGKHCSAQPQRRRNTCRNLQFKGAVIKPLTSGKRKFFCSKVLNPVLVRPLWMQVQIYCAIHESHTAPPIW
jgi:hypothetical protein